MVDYLAELKTSIADGLNSVFEYKIDASEIHLAETKKEFQGAYTLVVFPFTRTLRKKPVEIAEQLGSWLQDNRPQVVQGYNVVKGFLNIEVPHHFWHSVLAQIYEAEHHGIPTMDSTKVMVEFASPNTNKPLHLGHIRNILLGWSMSKILEAVGHPVCKTQIVNDRGIAICKSMLAWKLYGDNETPETSSIKGDHLVGKYYRKFNEALQEEYLKWQSSEEGIRIYKDRDNQALPGDQFFKQYKNQYFNQYSRLGHEAREMLLHWEEGDTDVRALWERMNGWVYDGFNTTYENLGVTFDKLYYESETYLLGKDIVQQGLDSGDFYRADDGSVWVDLEDRGLDKKILLRSDGTSVYMTQDLGTAKMRYRELGAKRMIYVVGDEQDYHFQVLFEIVKKLKEPYADGLYHLSYGMVDLPTGRMKSREGTVVDADDLIAEVIQEVRHAAIERGELEDISQSERENIYRQIGLAALKFFLLKVNAKKRMVFDPKESVDLQGQTGPYIQNAFVRIKSIRRKLQEEDIDLDTSSYQQLDPSEIDLIKSLMTYGETVAKAATTHEPSLIASFAYELSKKFHKFYHDVSILKAESDSARAFRLQLSDHVATVLEHAMFLLGIEMPVRM